MIAADLRARIRRLFFAEHWRAGTIAAELRIHHDTVRRAIEADRFVRTGAQVRPAMVDPYKAFVAETLEQHPRLRATRLFEMVKDRGYAGSVVQLRRYVRTVRPAPKSEAFLRLATLPGEQAQVDWGNFGKIQIGHAQSTLAGSAWQFGSADGTDSTAGFGNPLAVAADGSGNIYVADTLNSTIRKITTPSGVVSTLAGSAPRYGSADGTGSTARFWGPAGVAADGSGNVYVADRNNSTIRKITPAGVVSTLAGSARLYRSADGPGSAAYFYRPFGLATDASGNVYVADSGNSTIRKITPAGVVSTFAGSPGQTGNTDGTGSAARFSGPAAVAVDGSGNVYVADMYNSTVRKITPGGVVSTLAGSAVETGTADGTGPAARFLQPDGVAVDASGNVYVADRLNDTIRKITPAGVVSTLAGSPGQPGSTDGIGSEARFYNPQGLSVDASGNLYVADSNNSTIRKITPAGVVTTVVGTPGKSGTSAGPMPSRLFGPVGVAVVPTTGNLVITVPDAVLEASL